MTTALSSVFDSRFKAYMTYTTSSTNAAFKVTVTAAGLYQSCSWSNYPWKTTMTATDYASRSASVGTTRYEGEYHAILSADKTYSWTRKTSSYSVSITVTTKNAYNGKSGSKTVTFTVPALTKYTITYNANGGSGAPSSTTKYYGKAATLSSTRPTRTGYTFLGWATSSTATSPTWIAGGTYSTNASDTLYAVWKANTYTITYNANGGSGAPPSQTKTYGKTITLSSVKPTRTHHTFLGWSTSSTSTSATWAAGASFNTNITKDTILYAVWKKAYVPPSIKVTAKRTNSNGEEDDAGLYGVATISWTNATIAGSTVTPTEVTVRCSLRGADSWTTVYSVIKLPDEDVIKSPITTDPFQNGDAALSTESQYDIKVTITDAYGSTSAYTFISKAEFVIDINEDGTGICIGGACSRTGFSTAWDMWMDNGKGFYCGGTNGLWYNMVGSNSSDTFHFGYGGYNNSFGTTYYNGNKIYIRSREDVTIQNNVVVPNGKAYYGTFTDGSIGSVAYINSSDNTVIGYGGYNNTKGSTNIYGNSIYLNGGDGNIYSHSTVIFDNTKGIRSYYSDGETHGSILYIGSSNSIYVAAPSQDGINNVYLGASCKNIYLRTANFSLCLSEPDSSTSTYAGHFHPTVSGTVTLGRTSYRWYRLYQEYSSISTSDKRQKENIKSLGKIKKKRNRSDGSVEEFDVYSELFNRLDPVEYNFINGQTRKDFGLIAQDVIKAMAELGLEEDELDLVHHETWIDEETGEEKDAYGIAYENLISLLIHEVQKLKGVKK